MDRDPDFLNEEEAARLWQRAAQLQAEAAHKAEALAEEPKKEESDVDPPEGYALTHVRSAALEVGIGSEFVDAALADLRAERALSKGRRGWRLTRWFLQDPPDMLTVRRVIEAAPPEVLSAMEAIFPQEPYRLTFTDGQGDPLSGGVLIFDIQGLQSPFPQGLALEAKYAGIRQVFVSLRPIDGDRPSCEVTLRGPLAWSQNMNLGVGGVFTGIAGGLGAGGGAAVGSLGLVMGLGPVGVVLATVIAVGGGVMGGALGVKGFRALYAYGIRRGRKALRGLLGAVAGRAQGGWGIAALQDGDPTPALPGAPSS